jgi:Transglycosylase-like domain
VAGVRGVRPMRITALIAACAAALALVPAGTALASGGQPASGGTEVATAAVPPSAKPAPKRYRSAYKHWRGRLERHGVYVGRDLLVSGRARAAEDGSASPSKAELRHSIHRMQRRWTHWLRDTARGQTVAFKLKVRRDVPSWGKAHLRSIAWCESKNNPRAIGGGGAYRGMYQFSFSTWAVVGGSGDPAAASRWEQTWRAWLLLSRHGSGHWPNCG